MSGLYLLALIGLWLLVGWVIYRLWRQWKPQSMTRKFQHIVVGALLLAIWFGGAFWEVTGKKIYWDAKVREMCAMDGGVKVYETVELTEDKFNQWGQPNFYGPNKDKDLLAQFLLKQDTIFIRSETSNPSILKHHFSIYRLFDGKLLGEQISYARRGGDFPGPWHPSSFSCPNIGENGILRAVFIQKLQKGE